MSRIVWDENHALIEPFEVYFLITSHREEHGRFIECLYERESLTISILQSHYFDLSFDDSWLPKMKYHYGRYVQTLESSFGDTSIDGVILSLINSSKWKDQKALLTSLLWKPGMLGNVISSLERYGFEYALYSNVRHFDQEGLGATMITSNEDEIIICSDSEIDFTEKNNRSRAKQVIEQSIPRVLVVMDNHEGKWFSFEIDRRSLLGLERGHSNHIHFSSNLSLRGDISCLISNFKSMEHMRHGHSTHIVYSEFDEPTLNVPVVMGPRRM